MPFETPALENSYLTQDLHRPASDGRRGRW